MNKTLSPVQQEIATDTAGSTLVIAVPGAGKTTILLERMKYLLDMGVDPKRILTISFSRAAANELRDRFKALSGSGTWPDFHTIHAFAFMILRDYQKREGRTYHLLEGHPKLSKYRTLSEINYHYNKEYLSEEQLDNLLNEIGYVKNMMIDPHGKNYRSQTTNFVKIYDRYEQFKKQKNLIDFDDMLTLGYQILKNDKPLRKKYTNKYDYIQVDEGQDTSKIQMEIIKLLSIDKDNLFLVADDDQSIYSFRGADPGGILNLKDSYKDMDIYYMETNYRSTKNIVHLSNKFISANKTRFEKSLQSFKDYAEPISVVKVKNPLEQYKYILEHAGDMNDTGVLYRNNISAMGLIEYLEARDIPFRISNSNKLRFYTNRVAQDMINILRFAEDPSDIKALEEIFYKVDGYISRRQINYLKSQKHMTNLLDGIINMPGNPPFYFDSIRKLKGQLDTLNRLDFKYRLEHIAYDMGYMDYLDKSSKRLDKGVQNQKLLLDNLIQISKSTESLELFEARLQYLDSLVYMAKDNTEGIMLSTVHSAKGQEYSYIFIIDVYDGVFPSIMDEDTLETLEEERRLFYVAMTRAKKRLAILYPHRVMLDQTEESTFVSEIKALNRK